MLDIITNYLVAHIPTIALLISIVLLIFFSDFFDGKIVFPIADQFRESARKSVSYRNKAGMKIADFFGKVLATIIFLFYCYFGSSVLSEYVFAPILYSTKKYIIIIVLVLFLVLNKVINHKGLRKKYLGA